jgi:hypothetical protein
MIIMFPFEFFDTLISKFIYRPLAKKSKELLEFIKEQRLSMANLKALGLKRKKSEENFRTPVKIVKTPVKSESSRNCVTLDCYS